MTNYVLLGLAKRRAELVAEYEALEAQMAALSEGLVHLDAVIRLFDPEISLKPLGSGAQGHQRAKRGERSRVVLDVLREAGEPLPTAEIAERVIRMEGHAPEDNLSRRHLVKTVETALGRQGRNGVARPIREPGRLVRWEIVR